MQVTYQGRTLAVADLARELGLEPATLRARIKRWPQSRWTETPTRFRKRFARPTTEQLRQWRDDGMSQSECAARIRVSTTQFCSWVRESGIDWRNRHYALVLYKGRWVPIRVAARLSGINYHTLHSRHHRGWRGAALFRPVSEGRHSRQPVGVYEVGFTHEEWQQALAVLDHYTRELGCRHAAKRKTAGRFGVPVGALGAAERGEWERLG